MDLVETKLQ